MLPPGGAWSDTGLQPAKHRLQPVDLRRCLRALRCCGASPLTQSSLLSHLKALVQLEQLPAEEVVESGEWASVCPSLRTALAQATTTRQRLLRVLERLVAAARASSAAQQLVDLGALLAGDALATQQLSLLRHPFWQAEAALRHCWQARHSHLNSESADCLLRRCQQRRSVHSRSRSWHCCAPTRRGWTGCSRGAPLPVLLLPSPPV